MPVLKGIPAAPGVASGRAVMRRSAPADRRKRLSYPEAVARTRRQLEELARGVAAEIVQVQIVMLDDPLLTDAIERGLGEGLPAEETVGLAVSALAGQFAKLGDARLRERAVDVADLGRRLIRNLTGGADETPAGAGILFADSVTPSEVSQLDPAMVPGLVTERGGSTGHAAILARSLRIAAVMGVEGALERVKEGDWVIVDGTRGEVTIGAAPTEPAAEVSGRALSPDAFLPAVTRDGFRVELAANIAGPQDVAAALAAGADSIGVVRTEFLFLNRLPSEDEQYECYRQIVAGVAPRRVVIRTLDAGGDKELPYLGLAPEPNPALGLRGIRLCLRRPDLFSAQLRAIARAARHGNAAVLLPMVSDVCEVRRTRELLPEPIALGVMIETPAAALMAPELAREADFFSVGTNDLIQYVLAMDRLNEHLAAEAFHPAVLRMIQMVCAVDKPVAVCGEMAADPLAAPLLMGLGVGELSMNAASIPAVRAAIRALDRSAARSLAADALHCATAGEVLRHLRT